MQFSEIQTDVIKDIINQGIGNAAMSISQLTENKVELNVPSIRIIPMSSLLNEMSLEKDTVHSSIDLGFTGGIEGTASLIFPSKSATELVSLLTGEMDGTIDLEAVRSGTLSEVGNIVINSVMGSISNSLKQKLEFHLPQYREDLISNLFRTDPGSDEAQVLLANAEFNIEKLSLSGNIILVFEERALEMIGTLVNSTLQEAGNGKS